MPKLIVVVPAAAVLVGGTLYSGIKRAEKLARLEIMTSEEAIEKWNNIKSDSIRSLWSWMLIRGEVENTKANGVGNSEE